MKAAIIILLFAICAACVHEKSIEVEKQQWVLIAKKDTSRLVNNEWKDYVWLTWQNNLSQIFTEMATKYEASLLPIGTRIYNKVKR